jgi:hypothetical protein
LWQGLSSNLQMRTRPFCFGLLRFTFSVAIGLGKDYSFAFSEELEWTLGDLIMMSSSPLFFLKSREGLSCSLPLWVLLARSNCMNSYENPVPRILSFAFELFTMGLKLALYCLLMDLIFVALIAADRPKLTLFRLC